MQRTCRLLYFYLTDINYYPDEALNACAAGYHMASLWEILNVSNLTCAHSHPDAYMPAPAHLLPGTDGYVPAGTVLAAALPAAATV